MRRRYRYYRARLIGAPVVLVAWVAAFVWIGDSWWQLASAAVLGVALTRIAFLEHAAAHRQTFTSGTWNDCISLTLANFFVGISYGCWRSKHTPAPRRTQPGRCRPRHRPGAIAMALLRWLVAQAVLLAQTRRLAGRLQKALTRDVIDRALGTVMIRGAGTSRPP